MLMVDFDVLVTSVVKEGVVADLVALEITRMQSSYGLVGPPVKTETAMYKVGLSLEETKRRITKAVVEGIVPSFEVEDSLYPHVPSHLERGVRTQLHKRRS